MNRRFTQALIVFFIIASTVIGAMYFKGANTLIAEPILRINEKTVSKISGVLNINSSIVEFESHMKSSTQASVQVRVDNLILDAEAEFGEDGKKKVVIIDGHGKTLTRANKEALITLSNLLERHLDPYRQTIQLHEDLLVRTVGLWAEAPVGFQLSKQEFRP